MLRDIDLSEISDGKLYGPEDMVKVGSHDCQGCSSCCHDIEGLFLDPLDVDTLTKHLGCSFDSFLDQELQLDFHDGLLLPKMRMREKDNACHFLDEDGRCSIHGARPGICRLFPLGRNYEDGDYKYFLQIHECAIQDRYKMRVRKWVGVENYKQYHRFVLSWHDFTKEVSELLPDLTQDSVGQVIRYILHLFYQQPYPEGVFYEAFQERLSKAQSVILKK